MWLVWVFMVWMVILVLVVFAWCFMREGMRWIAKKTTHPFQVEDVFHYVKEKEKQHMAWFDYWGDFLVAGSCAGTIVKIGRFLVIFCNFTIFPCFPPYIRFTHPHSATSTTAVSPDIHTLLWHNLCTVLAFFALLFKAKKQMMTKLTKRPVPLHFTTRTAHPNLQHIIITFLRLNRRLLEHFFSRNPKTTSSHAIRKNKRKHNADLLLPPPWVILLYIPVWHIICWWVWKHPCQHGFHFGFERSSWNPAFQISAVTRATTNTPITPASASATPLSPLPSSTTISYIASTVQIDLTKKVQNNFLQTMLLLCQFYFAFTKPLQPARMYDDPSRALKVLCWFSHQHPNEVMSPQLLDLFSFHFKHYTPRSHTTPLYHKPTSNHIITPSLHTQIKSQQHVETKLTTLANSFLGCPRLRRVISQRSFT